MYTILLRINGVNYFKYDSNVIPREGDYIDASDASYNGVNGCFKVEKVIHKLYKLSNNDVNSYIIIEANND